jgi:hypothetical protein
MHGKQESFIWGDQDARPAAGAQTASSQSHVTSPVVDLLQNTADRLFSRLFTT